MTHAEIVSLLVRYENALGQAWIADCSENVSARRLTAVWDNAETRRRDLVNALHATLAQGIEAGTGETPPPSGESGR